VSIVQTIPFLLVTCKEHAVYSLLLSTKFIGAAHGAGEGCYLGLLR
jgi:hypothetical protein